MPIATMTRPEPVLEEELSFSDLIEITASNLDPLDRERFGLQLAAAALRLCVPIPRDAGGWLSHMGRYLEAQPDAPHGVMRAIVMQIEQAVTEARAQGRPA
jgi:hypothetical protein